MLSIFKKLFVVALAATFMLAWAGHISCIHDNTGIVLTPPLPLVNVPFTIDVVVLPNAVLYVSIASDCSLPVSSMCTPSTALLGNGNTRRCNFTVSGADLDWPVSSLHVQQELHLCSQYSPSGAKQSIVTFQLHKVSTIPRYAWMSEAQTVIFNDATPVGTLYYFSNNSFCNTNASLYMTLTSSRTAIVPPTAYSLLFVCAMIPLSGGGQLFTRTSIVDVIAITNKMTITVDNPGAIFRYRTISLHTSSFLLLSLFLSSSPDCAILSQPIQTFTDIGSKIISLEVDVPHGTYYLCREINVQRMIVYVYMENKVSVKEYGLIPRAMYRNMATRTLLTNDANVTSNKSALFQKALFRNPDCTSVVLDWSTADTLWTVASDGLYTACVRSTGQPPEVALAVPAANITVYNLLTIQPASVPPVFGFNTTFEITGMGVLNSILVGLARRHSTTNNRDNIFTSLMEEEWVSGGNPTASLMVPTQNSQYDYFISTPVNTADLVVRKANGHTAALLPSQVDPSSYAIYQMGVISPRTYSIHYDYLLAHTPCDIRLDPLVTLLPNSVVKIVYGTEEDCTEKKPAQHNPNMCETITYTMANSSAGAQLSNVMFGCTGQWHMCIRNGDGGNIRNISSSTSSAAATFIPVGTLNVYGPAVVEPRAIVTHLITSLSVSAIPPGAIVYLSASSQCYSEAPIARATADSQGRATLVDVSYDSEGELICCVGYPTMTGFGSQQHEAAAAPAALPAQHYLPTGGTIVVLTPHAGPHQVTADATGALRIFVRVTQPVPLTGLQSCLAPSPAATATDSSACSLTLPVHSLRTTTPNGQPSLCTRLDFYANEQAGAAPTATTQIYAGVFAGVTERVSYTVCLYDAQENSVSAGMVSVLSPLSMQTAPTQVIGGLTTSLTFSGASWHALLPNAFVLVDDSVHCANFAPSHVYGSGTIHPDGSTEVFHVPINERVLQVCIHSSSSPFAAAPAAGLNGVTETTQMYMYGGQANVSVFTTLTRYAVIGYANMLSLWPALNTNWYDYLVPCQGKGGRVNCSDRGRTGPCSTVTPVIPVTLPLTLPAVAPGTYLACRSDAQSTVGANVTLTVTRMWSVILSAAAATYSTSPLSLSSLQQYVPFGVTITSGDATAAHAAMSARAKSAALAEPLVFVVCIQSAQDACRVGQCSGKKLTVQEDRAALDVMLNISIPVGQAAICIQPIHPTDDNRSSSSNNNNPDRAVAAAAAHDIFLAREVSLRSYVSPGAVISDTHTIYTSSGGSNSAHGEAGAGLNLTWVARLARGADCADSVATLSFQPIVGGQSRFTVTSCGANTHLSYVYYCERYGGGGFAVRGLLPYLSRVSCGADAAAPLVPVRVAPGASIADWGMNDTLLMNPRLSRDGGCGDWVGREEDAADALDTNAGAAETDGRATAVQYFPRYDEVAVLYVCAAVRADPTVWFTTTEPTMYVDNWKVWPLSVVSGSRATGNALVNNTIHINYVTCSSYTFFSLQESCADIYAAANGLSRAGDRSEVYRSVSINGMVYVCVRHRTARPSQTQTTPVATFLSITPPTVEAHTARVMLGAPYAAQVQITLRDSHGSLLYSMIPGQDTNSPYAPYYNTTFRLLFLSSSADCTDNITAQVDASGDEAVARVAAAAAGRVSFDVVRFSVKRMPRIRPALCGFTPAGLTVLAPDLAVLRGFSDPSNFTAGVPSPVYIPLYPSAMFQLQPLGSTDDGAHADGTGTFSAAETIVFATNSLGIGTVDLSHVSTTIPAMVYRLLVCPTTQTSACQPLQQTLVFGVSHYGLRNTHFVPHVPATLGLEGNLTVRDVHDGFSTSPQCAWTNASVGTWTGGRCAEEEEEEEKGLAAGSARRGGRDSSSTAICVDAWQTYEEPLYLCCSLPNETVVSLPMAAPMTARHATPSTALVLPRVGIQFGAMPVNLSQTNFQSCNLVITAATPSPAVMRLAVVQGDCCDPAVPHSNRVIGESSWLHEKAMWNVVLNHTRLDRYAADTYYAVCVWEDGGGGGGEARHETGSHAAAESPPPPPPPSMSSCLTVARTRLNAQCAAVLPVTHTLSTWAIVWIVVGALTALALIAGVLVWYMRRRRRRRRRGWYNSGKSTLLDGGEMDGAADDTRLVAVRQTSDGDASRARYFSAAGVPYVGVGNVNPLCGFRCARERSKTRSSYSSSPSNPVDEEMHVDSTFGQNTLEELERDARDQITLDEARDRFYIGLVVTKEMSELQSSAKNVDAETMYSEIGIDVLDTSITGELRSVEEINVDPTTMKIYIRGGVPAASAAQSNAAMAHTKITLLQQQQPPRCHDTRRACGHTEWCIAATTEDEEDEDDEDEDAEIALVPPEMVHEVAYGVCGDRLRPFTDTVSSRHPTATSYPYSSPYPSPTHPTMRPSSRANLLDEDEQATGDTHGVLDTNRGATPDAGDVGDDDAAMVRDTHDDGDGGAPVEHIDTNPVSYDAESRLGGEGEPEPAAAGTASVAAGHTCPKATWAHRHPHRHHGRHGKDEAMVLPSRQSDGTTAARFDAETTMENECGMGPVGAEGGAPDRAPPHGHAQFLLQRRVVASHRSHSDAQDEYSDDNDLSFTSTQRFYDETRYFLEEEASRRARLCNWESEDRAHLDAAYAKSLSRLARARRATERVTPVGSHDSEMSVEDYYRAPEVPGDLPQLPTAPVAKHRSRNDFV